MTQLRSGLFDTVLAELRLPAFPAVIGISGAQGSGKTTLAAQLVEHFSSLGLRAATVSLDDYYLTGTQRAELAACVHPLLRQRGVPGTHHIQTAIDDAMAVLTGKAVALPRFDKALDEPIAPLPEQVLDLLVVEGWCLGVKPQTEVDMASAFNAFEQQFDADGRWRRFVNQQLAGHYQCYWQLLRPLIWLQAPDWIQICQWRAQQERALRLRTGKGMDKNALRHFMGSFERFTQASFVQLSKVADIQLQLNAQHAVTRVRCKTT